MSPLLVARRGILAKLSAPVPYFSDPFATDTLHDGSKWTITSPSGAGTINYVANDFASGHGSESPQNVTDYFLVPVPSTSQPRTANREVRFKLSYGSFSSLNRFGVHISYINSTNWAAAIFENAGGGNAWFNIYGAGSGPTSSFGSTFSPPASGGAFTGWMAARKIGNVITMELWTTDPALGGSPFASRSYTLSGTPATAHGAGVNNKCGVGTQQGAFPGSMKFGDYTLFDNI